MVTPPRSETGVILQMQDYSIHDGRGVRTTIFLAGCSLRCQWCANPETWTKQPKLAYYRHKCKSCQSCLSACTQQTDPRQSGMPCSRLKSCGACVAACPARALTLACTETSVDDIYQQIQRDELFFRYSGGGVTFSGGEPFLQHQFLRAIMHRCEPLGVSFWAETCGYFNWPAVRDLMPRFEHIFFDLKHMDSAIHERFTGLGNEHILQNVRNIYQSGVPVTIRIPFIPEVNGHDRNIEQTAQFMAEYLPGSPIELLPYHELGKAKYTAFHLLDAFHSFSVPSPAMLERAYRLFARYGVTAVDHV